MEENKKEKFRSLAYKVEDATVSRDDFSDLLNELIYYSQSEKYELSDDVVQKATMFLDLLLRQPSLLELANPVLKCFEVAFEAGQKKEHPVPLPQIDPSTQHTSDCWHLRESVTEWSTHYRDAVEESQFTEILKDPIAKFKRRVVRFTCQRSAGSLLKVGSALEDLVKPYPEHELSREETQALALGVEACSYALDAGVAPQADNSSLPLRKISRKHTDSPGYVPNESSAEPFRKRRRIREPQRATFSKDPLDNPLPVHCAHEGPSCLPQSDCACTICYEGCGCDAGCEKRLPPCDCVGSCREQCACIQNSTECIEARCGCSDCHNNFQEQKPVKLDELPEGGVSATQDLEAGTFLGLLKGQLCIRPREEMDTEQVYAIAKDAVVDVSGEDSTLHHIQTSSLRQAQNVKVLPYRCPNGHILIIQTTQHVRARTQLFLSQHPTPRDRLEVNQQSITPTPEGVGTDGSRWPGSGNTIVYRDNDESSYESEESYESDVSEYRDVDDNRSGSNIVDVPGLSGSDHREDNTIIVDPCQKVKRGRKKSEKWNILHEVLRTFDDRPFSKTDLEEAYKEMTGSSASPRLTIWLRDCRCCTSEGGRSKKRWTHNSKNCECLSTYPPSVLHYAISTKKTISLPALAKLSNYSSSYTSIVLRQFPCCQHAKDTSPSYYFHDPAKCTTKTYGITKDIKEAVKHIEQQPRVQFFRWNKEADAILLQLESGNANYNKVREELRLAFPMHDFEKVDVDGRWQILQGNLLQGRWVLSGKT